MTRINTNVSSLVAQNTLRKTNSDLQQSLTRLSTGLRINVGKDDPAGLIASEALRSDITAIERAIGNTERANQAIATADSALGQVSKLLNDIRGLVVEAANTGAVSSDQIAANQVQVDSSLEAINRISQTTTFQGRRLLDGSLDFITSIGNVTSVTDVEITQANLGSIDVDIASAATQATIANASAVTTNANATATLLFAAEATLTGFAASGAETIDIRATTAGASLEGVVFAFQLDAAVTVGSEYAVYDSAAGTVDIHINNLTATDFDNVTAALDALAEFSATNSAGATAIDPTGADATITDTSDADEIVITAATAGPDFNNLAVSVTTSAAAGASAVYNSTLNTLELTINDTSDVTLAAANTAINNLAEFSSVGNANGDGNVNGSTADANATANTDTTGGGTISDDLIVQVSGVEGSEVFNFDNGAAVNQIVDALNLVSDATGVTASQSAGTLTFLSQAYGSNAFVQVDVISEGTAGTFGSGLANNRATGTDIVATVNGIQASGDGNTFSINTSTLDLSITVADGNSDNFNFDITGGGALFQLGPDVVSNQQARLGIQSLSTARLGGASGTLFELGSGGARELSVDPAGAASIVQEVINKVTNFRGRLGAFQRTTLDTNIDALNDTLANLTEAESAIRDADFAVESSLLTRAQILVQSGTSVLAIANSNPQNILALLR